VWQQNVTAGSRVKPGVQRRKAWKKRQQWMKKLVFFYKYERLVHIRVDSLTTKRYPYGTKGFNGGKLKGTLRENEFVDESAA
jgi:hypothetical protein